MIHAGEMSLQDVQTVPPALKEFAAKDDAGALLLMAKAYEQANWQPQALAGYRRIYFFAPASAEAAEAATSITRLSSTTAPASAEEASARAGKLFAEKHCGEAFDAYTDAFTRFPNTATAELQARRSIAASNARRFPEAAAALSATSGEARAEALFGLAMAYGRAKQWAQARSATEDLRRAFPGSTWTTRAFVQLGQHAEDAKDGTNASYFYRAAVNFYPGNTDVTPAQFYLAWQAHEAKNCAASSRVFTEQLAVYAGNNTDFRGKAAYWAARDSERSGKLTQARVLYEALQLRYDANWYGYLAKQRLDTMNRNGVVTDLPLSHAPANSFPDPITARAVENLKTVSVADERPGPSEDTPIPMPAQLS